MSGFSADWLALRAPFDGVARARVLEEELARWAEGRGEPLRIVDLGAGTGANLRHLAPRLPGAQCWTLVELDPALIAAGEPRLPRGDRIAAAYRRADLVAELEAALAEPVDLVTCSALLDLVSAAWLDRLVRIVLERDLALLAVLTYDGRVVLEPPHPLDGAVIDLVNRHQRTDKGFGPALGPEAAFALARSLDAAGDRPRLERSDWTAGPEDRAFQAALVEGWAAAAAAIAPERASAVASWRQERLQLIATGRCGCRVGHRDLLRLPRGQGRAPQAAEEQPVAAERQDLGGEADRLVHPRDRRQAERVAARADDDRGDAEMEEVETTGGEEAGDGHPTALDEEPPDAPRAQRIEHAPRLHRPVLDRQSQDLGLAEPRGILPVGAAEQERGRRPLPEHPVVGAEPAIGIEDHAQGARPGHEPDGEPRIVVRDGSCTHEHGVRERPQPVHVDEIGLAGDVTRMAGLGRDPAVEALPQMRHHPDPVRGGSEKLAIGGQQPLLVWPQPVERQLGRIGALVRAGEEPLPGPREARLAASGSNRGDRGRRAVHSRIASSSTRIGTKSATQPLSTA